MLPTISNVLDKLLSNTNGLTTQDVLQNVFSQLQKKDNEEAERLAREREEERQREEELNEKNEELKELIENDEIKIFQVIKGHDIGNGRSAVILQLDRKIVLDSNKYYIAKYTYHPEWEGDEYLHFVSPRGEMLVDYENLFFVLNQSSYSGFESGFYSADSTDPYNYAKYSKEPYLSGDQLSEKLSNELKEDSNQIDAEVMFSDQPMNEEVTVKSEVKSRKKRAVEEDDNGETVGNLANIQARSEDKKITAVERQENSVLQKTAQKLFPNKDDIAVNDNLTADKNNLARLLHIAISKGNVDEAMRLIKQVGTDITYMGRSPLYFASEIGNFDMVKLLIEHGVTPNNRDALGSTPLIVAIGKGDVKIVEYLIKAGANVNLSDQYGNVPLDFAPGKNMEIAKLLIDEGASFNRVMHVASIVNDTELVKYLITKGVDVNCKSKIGDTPLHDAANRGNLYQFSLLGGQIGDIAELFNYGVGKRGNKITQSA
ncbi:MAG: ankyrin repeat domain-containing protein, partial [Wolbachia endosymbiont of Tetragnatha montana]|nr:ankyrin repeat domain-containing protein [Wolbachia endosymbiont of Tetragnatha montana]